MKRILIIEDDEEFCEELSEILEETGYSVETVFNGLEGNKKIEEQNYDLVILDLKIPGMNGLDILKKKRNKKIKFMVLSGSPVLNKIMNDENTDVEDEKKQLLNKAEVILSKPFSVEDILNKIKELI